MQNRAVFSFVEQLDSVSLRGLRIGKLTSYFERGSGQVTRVIDDALEQLESAGVEIIEFEIPDLDSLLSGSGLIGHEFRNDLNQYLAMFSDANITLADIVDEGLFHDAVQGALTRSRNAEFDEDAYQTAFARRQVLQEAIERVMIEQQLDAIAYPTIGELQVFTGESQSGSNCSVSANSGLPAISLPAGFTNSGLPVGMELLGRLLSDAQLVSIAHQFEKLSDMRQAPSTTPPLINGRAPFLKGGGASISLDDLLLDVSLNFETTTNLLRYQVNNNTQDLSDLYALTLVIDDDDIAGPNDPVAYNLIGPATESAEGEIFASPALREAIMNNKLYFRVFGAGAPDSGMSGSIEFGP
jgi:hypothetical protein